MIHPQEFLRRYGPPHPKTIAVSPGYAPILPPSEHRYLLIFTSVLDGVKVRCDFSDAGTVEFEVPADAHPLIFTHALHGAFLYPGWSAEDPTKANSLTIVEAFAAPFKGVRETYGRTVQTNSGSRTGNPSRSGRFAPSRPESEADSIIRFRSGVESYLSRVRRGGG